MHFVSCVGHGVDMIFALRGIVFVVLQSILLVVLQVSCIVNLQWKLKQIIYLITHIPSLVSASKYQKHLHLFELAWPVLLKERTCHSPPSIHLLSYSSSQQIWHSVDFLFLSRVTNVLTIDNCTEDGVVEFLLWSCLFERTIVLIGQFITYVHISSAMLSATVYNVLHHTVSPRT